jgi:hypothetical protein
MSIYTIYIINQVSFYLELCDWFGALPYLPTVHLIGLYHVYTKYETIPLSTFCYVRYVLIMILTLTLIITVSVI